MPKSQTSVALAACGKIRVLFCLNRAGLMKFSRCNGWVSSCLPGDWSIITSHHHSFLWFFAPGAILSTSRLSIEASAGGVRREDVRRGPRGDRGCPPLQQLEGPCRHQELVHGWCFPWSGLSSWGYPILSWLSLAHCWHRKISRQAATASKGSDSVDVCV